MTQGTVRLQAIVKELLAVVAGRVFWDETHITFRKVRRLTDHHGNLAGGYEHSRDCYRRQIGT